ncbi:MAG: Fur family transcriptional regulator [Thermodesulfobacteriota bacterium]
MKLAAIKLKQIGLRVTPQRQAVLKLLKGNPTHPSAEDVYHEVLKEYPRISFATVYNTLSKLAEAGEIQELDIDPSKKRFDPSLSHHSHFYCRVCTKVYDVEEELPIPKAIRRIAGHEIEAIQVNLKGVCDACAGKRKGK